MNLSLQKDKLPPYSVEAKEIKIGSLYEHYSGKRYKILAIARHSESLEEIVVYQALYGEQCTWVRPLEMFCSTVEIMGCIVPRFRCLHDQD